MFVHATRPFLRCVQCLEAVVAAPEGWESRFQEIADREWGRGRVQVVTGGATRQESVARALAALVSDAEFVLIHDAARPLVSDEIIARVLAALRESVATVPVLPVVDTLKRTDGTAVFETVARAGMVAAQTPQGILRAAAGEAQRRAGTTGFEGTDDVSLIEHFALGTVRTVAGDPGNLKITTGEDLALAKKLMEPGAPRIGAAGKGR